MNDYLGRSETNAFVAWMHHLDSFYNGNPTEQRAFSGTSSPAELARRASEFIGATLRDGGSIQVTTGPKHIQDTLYGADLPPNTVLTFTQQEFAAGTNTEPKLFDPVQQAELSLSGIASVLGRGGQIRVLENPANRF